jgi:hypothetical protein
MGIMDKMVGGGKEMEMPLMPKMMTDNDAQCLKMMLSNRPREKRIDLVLKMVAALMEQGCAGM